METLASIEGLASRFEDRPVSTIGRMEALSLLLVDAVRNAYRGASAVLGASAEPVRNFETRVPNIKDLRDRFEHFDAYLRGVGHAQTGGRGKPALELGGQTGLAVAHSNGGGPGGHTITVEVYEAGGKATVYTLATRAAVEAAQLLTRAVVEAAGLDDARHADCTTCYVRCR